MRKAFTLVELLVVVAIMGLLGTASVGGYRAMQRGMADKGVMQNVNSLIRAAYQRAQVDRQPTVLFFWNETVRGESADDTEIVVGHAVAVRRSGRITQKSGQFLYDEFADLHLTYQTSDEEGTSDGKGTAMYLYPMENLDQMESSGNLLRSTVEGKVYLKTMMPIYCFEENETKSENMTSSSAKSANGEKTGKINTYAFKLIDAGGVTWKAGSAYGFEFANIELPQGYIFGQNYSKNVNNPVREVGTMTFDVGYNNGNGMQGSGSRAGLGTRTSIAVYALRPDTSGNLAAQKVGDSDKPTEEMR